MQEQPKKQAIPSGWAYSTLGEIASYINGRAFKPDEWQSFGKPIIRIQNLNNPDAKVNYSSVTHEDRYKVNQGDILYAWSASLGAHTWRGGEAWLNQHIFRVVPYSCCNKSFIFYLLHKFTQDLYKKSHGSGMVHVTKGKFEETEVILPPFNEQIRIAGALDELFSGLDAAVAELKRIKTNIKRYRASVLQAAVEGRLTAEWRKQNPPSETGAELLARLLKERRAKWEENQLKKYAEQGKTPPKDWKEKYPEPAKPDTIGLPELPEGWVWGTLDQISSGKQYAISDGPFGSNLKTEHYTHSGPRVIRLQNIGFGEFIDENAHISESHYSTLLKHSLSSGDIVIAMLGEILPRACLVPDSVLPAIVKADCAKLSVNLDCVRQEFVNYSLNSENTRRLATKMIKGVGRPRLNLAQLKTLPVALPDKGEQEAILEKIESRLSIADAADKTIASALQRAARLRQSILKRAFEGRLVPQDPSDEPASMLLERIRAERAELAATVKPARTKRKGKGDAG